MPTGSSKRSIVVTNDDGVYSQGILALSKAMSRLARIDVVCPLEPRSATSMSLTFHKPLRISKIAIEGKICYAVSGSPADAVMIAVHKIVKKKPSLVVSGINMGDNTTLQDLFASGTVAAAMEAAIMEIPSIAYSMQVPDEMVFSRETPDIDFANAAEVAVRIAEWVLENGLPQGAQLLNVNFPPKVDRNSEIRITRLARRKYQDQVVERRDPRGKSYYWIWGKRLDKFEQDTDAHAIHVDRVISISPVNLNLSSFAEADLSQLAQDVNRVIKGMAFKAR